MTLERLVLRIGALAGAVTATGALWLVIGGPLPALSSDIQRLDRQQTEQAIDIYSKEVRDQILLLGLTKNDPTAKAIVERNLEEAKEKLQRAQNRKIELSK